MRTVAIVNPAASSGGAAKTWPAIEEALRRQYPQLEVLTTNAPGHATELCRYVLQNEGANALVISVGGDGTNNEVLQGFCDTEGQNQFPEATLGVIAAGTGGDFQRHFGTMSPARQVKRLATAAPREIDYGVARFEDHAGKQVCRAFLNTASVGISGLVVQHVTTASRSLGSQMAYVTSSLKGIWGYRNKQAFVRRDEEPERRVDLTLVLVANGQYFGAGMWACPDASVEDGKLDGLELSAMSRVKLMSTLAKVFNGSHLRVKGVRHGQVSKLSVRPVHANSELLIELDGEQPGRAPADFWVVPSALRVLVA